MTTESYSNQTLVDITIGERKELNAKIVLVDYNLAWPDRYKEIEKIIKEALGAQVLLIEHVGSTSVPGLSAKPIIDIILEVQNSADESKYVAVLEEKAFKLRIREPDWYEHFLLKLPDVNLHVFSANCLETKRMLTFRDWLRNNPDDQMLYQRKKADLADKIWKYT